MDVADAYIDLYDALVGCDQTCLIEWSEAHATKCAAAEACSVAEAEGHIPDDRWRAWLPDGAVRSERALGVLLGLDKALLNADPDIDDLDCRGLGELRSRALIGRRLNCDKSKGALLFRRATPCRPSAEPQTLDEFLHLIRIPPHLTAKVLVRYVNTLDDLPDLDDEWNGSEEQTLPRLPIAQLPMLAEAGDLIWETTDDPPHRRYSVKPRSAVLAAHVPEALEHLDSSGAFLALLPEACLDDALLSAWRRAMRTSPPQGSRLTWLLLGTGPIRNEGPHVDGPRPPNRAVLLHRSGKRLITQDKQRGFCLTLSQQRRYGLDPGGNREEYIALGRETFVLEARHGRFAILICEDLKRADLQERIIKSGTTHVMVPVLAGAMWKNGWQAPAALRLAEESGTDVAVSNGLAIERDYNGMPAPTLLVFSVPPGHDEYLRADQLLDSDELQRRLPASVPPDARADALTPRTADWLRR